MSNLTDLHRKLKEASEIQKPTDLDNLLAGIITELEQVRSENNKLKSTVDVILTSIRQSTLSN